MKVSNLGEFNNLQDFVVDRIKKFWKKEKTFNNLFDCIFSQRDSVFAEYSNGYKIAKISYGECADKIKQLANVVQSQIDLPKGSKIGLAMDTSLEWIQVFWALVIAGYNPVLFNLRLPIDTLESVVKDFKIKIVVSDKLTFSAKTIFSTELYSKLTDSIYTGTDWGNEAIFMSSGTTGNVKLCVYTAENFFNQVVSSDYIVKTNKYVGAHYKGELKNLVIIPLYHVFGFIAIHLWYAFFSRTLVFLKDLQPQTLISTIKKHEVTHIFAVPLVWEKIYSEAVKKVKARGDATYKKFLKGIKIANSSKIGALLTKNAFKEIREGIFGDSIQYLITGGSGISKDALAFYNAIGYPMANGYGMTETGIVSLEFSHSRKVRILGSIGNPFLGLEYRLNDKGELLLKSNARASKIITKDEVIVSDYNEWFNTHDLAEVIDGKFYIRGRVDDLIVCANGENLNPEILEKNFMFKGVKMVAMFMAKVPTLLVSIEKTYSSDKILEIYNEIIERLKQNNLQDEIKKVVLTYDSLMLEGDFKLGRKKLAKKLMAGLFEEIDVFNSDKEVQKNLGELEKKVIKCFADVLEKSPEEIVITLDFFIDLGGSSLDYFSLLEKIRQEFNVDISTEQKLSTVEDFCKAITNK